MSVKQPEDTERNEDEEVEAETPKEPPPELMTRRRSSKLKSPKSTSKSKLAASARDQAPVEEEGEGTQAAEEGDASEPKMETHYDVFSFPLRSFRTLDPYWSTVPAKEKHVERLTLDSLCQTVFRNR